MVGDGTGVQSDALGNFCLTRADIRFIVAISTTINSSSAKFHQKKDCKHQEHQRGRKEKKRKLGHCQDDFHPPRIPVTSSALKTDSYQNLGLMKRLQRLLQLSHHEENLPAIFIETNSNMSHIQCKRLHSDNTLCGKCLSPIFPMPSMFNVSFPISTAILIS